MAEPGSIPVAVEEAALNLTKAFGPNDPRLATTLNNLALFYAAQGRFAGAEPFGKRR